MELSKLRRRIISPAVALGLACVATVFAAPRPQSKALAGSSDSAATSTEGAASAAKGMQSLREGTKISTKLESALDARTTKPGQEVKARVTKNVKEHGRTVIHKGDMLIGHVTKVQSSASGKAGSAIGVAFDRLQSRGGATTQLNTVVTSVFSAPGQGGLSPAPMRMPEAAPVPMSSGGGGGGLLGGVGSTAGAGLGATAGVVGPTAGSLGATARSAAGATLGGSANAGLATPVRDIHLNSQAGADSSVGQNSMLSTRRGDLRLDYGTQMQFRVAGNAQAGKGSRQK